MWFRSTETNRRAPPCAPDLVGPGSIDRTIARLNIEHYRKLLSEEKDEVKRLVLFRLLAEEEAKLTSLDEND